MKTKIALDATLLTSLMSCPRMADFRFNKLLQSKSGKSNALECGSLVHTILEFYNKARIAGKDRNTAISIGFAAGKEYKSPFSEHNLFVVDPDHTGMNNTPEESDKRNIGYSYVIDTMGQYFDYYRNESFLPLAAEEVRGNIIYEDDDLVVIWKAKFDVIIDTDQGLMSKDYKTMSQRRDTLLLNNQFIGQCLLLKSRYMIIDKIGFQSSLKPEEKFVRATLNYTADQFSEWANDIVPYYARMLAAYSEAGHYPPNYTHCENKYGKCNFLVACEADRGMRDEVLNVNFVIGKVWDISNI